MVNHLSDDFWNKVNGQQRWVAQIISFKVVDAMNYGMSPYTVVTIRIEDSTYCPNKSFQFETYSIMGL